MYELLANLLQWITISKNEAQCTAYRVFQYICPPPPLQTMSDAVQTIQIYRGKLEPISAIDFKGFWILSIFTIFS